MRRNLLILGALACASYINAEELPKDTLKTYNMNEIVVTATRIPQELKTIPQRIAVMPIYRLNANPDLSIDNVVNQISGANVIRRGGLISNQTVISLRGMGNNGGRTLIMMDGVPINKSSTGSANLNRYAPENLERIEVIKGPGSSLYGGNAMGGIVNFITRKPTDPLEGTAGFRWGEMGTFGSNASISGLTDHVYYRADGFYQKSNGYNTTPKADRDESTIRSNLNEYSIGGLIGYNINDRHSIEGNARHYDGKRGEGTRYFFTEPNKGQLDLLNRFKEEEYRLTYRGQANNTYWTASGFYGQEKYLRNRMKGSSLYDVDAKRRDWNIWLHGYNKSLDHNTIAAGLEVKGGYVDGNDVYRFSTDHVIDKGKSTTIGIWIQDEISLMDGAFLITPSLRYDHARIHDGGYFIENGTSVTSIYEPYTGELKDNTWNALSPKLCLQYTFSPNLRIFANSGWGFRPGNLEDMVWTGPGSGGVILANTQLKPEHLNSTEIGADWTFLNVVTVSPSVYYSRGRDFIYSVNTGETIMMGKTERPLLHKENLGKVEIFGAEIDLNAALSDHVNLFANYSYTSSKIKEGTASIYGKETDLKGHYLTYVPKSKIVAGGTWRNPYISMNASYVYYSSQFIDDLNEEKLAGYGIFDAKLWHDFNNRITVSLNANNLFDKRVEEGGVMSIGRMIFGEIKYRF